MEDLLKKWYKTSFKSLKVLTPYKVWRELEIQLKGWPKHWYQSNVDAIKVDVNENVWNGMHSQLAAINNQIKYRRKQPFRLALYTLLCMCVPFAFNNGGYELLNDGKGHSALAIVESADSDNKHGEEESNATIVNGTLNDNFSNYVAVLNNDHSTYDFNSISNETIIEAQESEFIRSDESLLENDLLELSALDLKVPVIETNVGFISILDDVRKFDSERGKWEIGMSAKVYNGGLINPVSLMARENSNVSQKRAIELSYGIRVARRLTARSAIQAELSMNDNRSHVYARKDNNNGLNETKFNFATVAVSSVNSFRIAKEISKRNQSINVATGLFYSHRYAASERQNNVEVDFLKSGYKRYNFGVNTGLEYSIELNKHFKWSTGLSYRAGLINLFDGVKKVPSDFYKTHSYSFGVSSSIVYLF